MSYNAASNADIDRRFEEALDEAEGILSRFADPETHTPNPAVSMDGLFIEKARRAGLNPGDDGDLQLATRSVRKVIKERVAGSELTRLGRVHLDMKGEHRGPGFLSPFNSIAFGALTSGDQMIRDVVGENVRAIAVYFDTSLAGSKHRKDKYTGEWVTHPNEYSPEGYIHIVGIYGSMTEAEEAREELYQAIRTIQKDGTDSAMEHDPIRSTGIEHTTPPPSELDSL